MVIYKMLPENLKELVNEIINQKTEKQDIELKAAEKGCPSRLYDTLSSFSNQDAGGILIFGIDETQNFKIVGVYDLQDLQKKVTEQCLQMEPPVRAVFTVAEYDGAYICSAEIPGLDISEQPCYYTGKGRLKGSYIRVGDADLPMTDYELYSLEAFRKHLHDDERVVERANLESLDQDSVTAYIEQKKIDRPKFAQLPENMMYEMLNILRNGKPTLAALLNFGIYPQGYFPQLGITAIVVPGTAIGDTTEQDVRFLDNKRIEGSLTAMVKEAIAFCVRNMKVRTVIDRTTGERKDQTEYPVAAIREAVLNAVIHRDYSFYTEGMPIQIDMFIDRMEIHSPGSLYGRMTVDQLGIAKTDIRNPALAVMAESMTEAENRYSGIPTMRNEMKAYGLPEPKFENRRNEFVVTFYNAIETSTTETDAGIGKRSLLDFCRTPRTRKEIADFLQVKTVGYAINKYVRPLVEAGMLQMTCPERPKSRTQKYVTVQQTGKSDKR
ncbi:ATP-binding protein [uncultured Megasphaera sp.]|uniref:ATP-binding protein n=1 Tax=uncultured Megasphaera sp. TaxID=165188 RepID=UPI002594FDD1|nr:ATP-binding protein [uncultured Megasphaera sp.]